ncbi:MAG: ATP-binding cassette domain-containing protein, partial [Acetobacteraceae bacterium]
LVQKEVLDLMVELTREIQASVLFITHDLGLAARYADEIAIMHQGEIVEIGATAAVLRGPRHEYAQRLLASAAAAADLPAAAPRSDVKTLASLEQVGVSYPGRKALFSRNRLHAALRGVTLDLREGETLAIVGESGSGKTTLGRALLGLVPLSSGRIAFEDLEIRAGERPRARKIWALGQMIFQDPYSSLDPRLRALEAVGEGLCTKSGVPSAARRQTVLRALHDVGLVGLEDRYPHQLSGGQRQRLCIARILALGPTLIVADEPVAALDATIQRQVLELFAELKRSHKFTCVFISHDLAAVRRVADRVAILYRGELLECGPTSRIFSAPVHAYTRALLEARPLLHPDGRGGFELQPPTASLRDRELTSFAHDAKEHWIAEEGEVTRKE